MSGNSFVDCDDPFSETPMQSESIQDIKGVLAGENGAENGEVDEPEWAEALSPEEIRWFFKDGVHKRWVEFCGYDSLRIENAWRLREAAREEARQERPKNSSPAESVVVRGGMYDVELDNMRCVSIYWPGEEWEIMRGTWFYDGSWIPIDTEDAKILEEAHLRLFEKPSPTPPTNGSQTPDQPPSPPHAAQTSTVLYTQHFPDFHVDWHAINDVTRYSEYKHSKLMRSVTSKLGFTKTTGYRLRRGYTARATMDDKPHDIDHLVFVVHGIGQKGDTGKIIRNTTSFRECVGWLEAKYFPNSKHRVEFFPVEWRSSLKLDGDIVDAITPYSVPGIRQLLNTSAMDILYYTSPLYGGEVRAGLQKELNRLYFKFSSRHPGWTGKVSILAHSLGCVIVYDIVTGWMGPDTRPPSPAAAPSDVSEEGLRFTIDNLFCLGSPLSVFLALRTRTPTSRLDVMPHGLCKRFYNIFHWSDPVAYRMEPLLERGYSKIDPVLILPYGGVDSQIIEPPPSIVSGEQAISPPENEDVERDETSPVGDTSNRNVEKGWSLWGLVRAGWTAKDGSSPTPDANPLRPDQELTERLDYVLRAGGLGRNYLYTVTAHTAYWNNYDVAYFVLTRLFPTLDT